MKRIEIVINEECLEELRKLLEEAGVRGFTVIKKAGGLGSTGERNPEDYALAENNAVIVLACEEKQAEKVITILHPRLKEFGGMCLISDCQWTIGPAASY
ncbi:MAG: transcriptional regulator [Proteobacteria bacterium]|nr:transcriptional regulator [Pseudomonadota bacterium]